MEQRTNVVRLQKDPAGSGAAMRSVLDRGRSEIVTVGPNSEFGFIGSDPYGTNAFTGLVVPPTPSSQIGDARYLFMLARATFGVGEQGSEKRGVKLVGIRQYAEMVARIESGQPPLASEGGPPAGSTVVFRHEIKTPMWHPPDGDISWHVMVINRARRDTRNPANTDGVIFQDSLSPALLYQTLGPYTPPNGGRPWGRPLAGSLGNIHELRYHWRDQYSEYALDIPVPVPSEVVLFASVRQNDPALNPTLADPALTQQFLGLSEEDQFLVAYSQFAQYGVVAGSLVFEEDLGKETP